MNQIIKSSIFAAILCASLTSCVNHMHHDAGKQDLFAAIGKEDVRRIRALITANPALAESTDQSGATPLLFSVYSQTPQSTEALRQCGLTPNIVEAAALGDVQRVRHLIERDASSVRTFSKDGFTPLHLAAFFGHPRVAELLLQHGADPNTFSGNALRATPLQSAAAGKNEDVAELLLNHNADPNVRGEGGYSPLHEAASNGQIKLAKSLLKHGAAINAKGDDGKTPLKVASESQQTAMVEFLKGQGGLE